MIDTNSLAWIAVKKHCEAGIELAASMLERVGMSEADTNALRGEIRAYRNVLALASPPPKAAETSPNTPLKRGVDPSGI